MTFTDSHCHLDFFAEPQAIAREAKQAGVEKIIIPAVSRSRWKNLLTCSDIAGVSLAFGMHPLYQIEHQREDISALENLCQQGKAVAIGECGLDFQAGEDPAQKETFYQQLLLAKKYNLPVLIHARKSLDQVLQLIKKSGAPKFVLHSFTGSDVQLQKLLDLGGYIGIGGTSTYPRAVRLRKQLSLLPADRYLLETDAPDQPICGRQGRENQPQFLPEIAENLAFLRGTTLKNISEESEKNIAEFFKIS